MPPSCVGKLVVTVSYRTSRLAQTMTDAVRIMSPKLGTQRTVQIFLA